MEKIKKAIKAKGLVTLRNKPRTAARSPFAKYEAAKRIIVGRIAPAGIVESVIRAIRLAKIP